MKRWLTAALLAVFLTGCSSGAPEEPVEIMTQPEAAIQTTTAPTEQTVAETVPETEPELLNPLINPNEEDFVRVKDYIPDVVTDLKYGSEDNFTGQVIYEFEDVFLRYGTVMKLKAVSQELSEKKLYLKIWDGFRPVSAQFKLWDICPDPTYVANPNQGYSNHSRGYAVDLTLVDENGTELEMPTGFDDFSSRADRDYSECSEEARNNAILLESVMEKYGFSGYWGEWWHFNDTRKYDVETCFDPGVIAARRTGKEAVLLEHIRDGAAEILKIPEGELVTLLGYEEGFAMVEYWGYRGYLPLERLM